MARRKYYGEFHNADDISQEFGAAYRWSDEKNPTLVEPSEVLLAGYFYEAYEGYALVIFKRDGKLYEVHGSHCSCYGLEGQWDPEETAPEALRMRPEDSYYYPANFMAEVRNVSIRETINR